MNQRGITTVLVIMVLAVVIVVVAILISRITGKQNPVSEVTQRASSVITGGGGFSFDESTPGYENYVQLSQGCPFKDCIPSIDRPNFETVNEADKWLEGSDVVFALDYEGEARAYPQRILNWHEIVNDTVSSRPLAITFCPLCGSALAFERKADGQVLEFGVSGKLHNNDLVMYDRQTETLWQQITGEAIVGELFGKRLKQIPLSGMRWGEFKKEFSNGQVLSRDTGFSRSYDVYPYGDYEQDAAPLFPVQGGVDNTIHPKTIVYGVEVGEGKYKAYPEEKIKKEGVIEDAIGQIEVRVSYKNGDIMVERLDTEKEIPATRLFWFAWKAFRSETELY